MRAILEGGGHKVIATFGAGEAIEVLERVCDIPLVITDIDMPGSMDGLRLAAAVRDRWPPIHLIIVTGFAPPNSYELPRDSLFYPKALRGGRNSLCGTTLPVDQAMLRRRQAFSAVCSSNLGKRGRRDTCSRRTLLEVALMSIVRSKKIEPRRRQAPFDP